MYVTFEFMLRHTGCITNGSRPVFEQQSLFSARTLCLAKKSKVSVLMQVVPKENVYTQRICIYIHTSSGGRQMIFIIYLFFAASKFFGGHHYTCMHGGR